MQYSAMYSRGCRGAPKVEQHAIIIAIQVTERFSDDAFLWLATRRFRQTDFGRVNQRSFAEEFAKCFPVRSKLPS